jgi:PAS domain S-box-containing protein
VLALYSESSDHPVNVSFIRQFHAVLDRESGNTVEHFVEYYEAARFPGEEQAQLMRDYLLRKYADRKIDVLFPWGPFCLQLVLKYRGELFPDTPIVYYSGTLDEVRDYPLPPMTGVLNPDTYGRTLDLMLQLHPDTNEVFVISGTPERDRSIERDVAFQLQEFAGRVKLTYLTDFPLDRLLATVKHLPRGALILYSRHQQDEVGSYLQQSDYIDMITRTAPVPLYTPWRSSLGFGSVGGVVDDLEAGAAKAAAIVLRVARGARPEEIPPERTPRAATFDARQLKRWGISEARLPPGSVVLFQEPTIWHQYRAYITATGAVLAVQTVLIVGLLAQRRKRRRTEALLARSEQRYALATAAGCVGVWEWHLDTGQIYVDPILKRGIGFFDDEIDDRVEAWMDRVHPDDRDRLLAESQAHMEGRTPSYDVEYRMLHKDGSIRWFLARGSALRLPDGRAVKIIGSAMDITERKRAEARLKEAEEELARTSKLTALGEFAASIAHEMSQPLGAVLMNASACLRWIRRTPPPAGDIRAALVEMVDDCKRARELMRRNRELFQHHTVEKLPLDINRVVHDVAGIARTRAQHSHVTLETTLDEDLPAVLGDRLELQQVILNLLQNALDAVEPVDPQQRRIHIRSSLESADMVRIEVEDTGVGLDQVDIARIFTPLYTTKPSGTGVGLSISRSIVEAHDGRLWAEPNDGPGACFVFTLPATAGSMSTRETDADRSLAARGGRSGQVA